MTRVNNESCETITRLDESITSTLQVMRFDSTSFAFIHHNHS